MSKAAYYLTENGGNGFSPDGTIPEGAMACSAEQYQNATAWSISGGKLVAMTLSLDFARARQTLAVKIACEAAITGGFTSAALGTDYQYPSDTNSQRNIAMAVTAGGTLWCQTGGVWALVKHTAAQAKQVQADLFALIQASQTKYAMLVDEIGAATTVEAVEVITW